MRRFTVVILGIFIISVFIFPYEYGRLWTLVFGSPQLYKPIPLDTGLLSSFNGKEYKLVFKGMNYYDIGISFDSNEIPSSMNPKKKPYKYKGLISIELISDNKVIWQENISEAKRYYFDESNINYYSKIILGRFPYPLFGNYSEYSMRIKLLKDDEALKEKNVQIFFSISSQI